MEWSGTISTTMATRAPPVLKGCWGWVTTNDTILQSINIYTSTMWQTVDLLECVDGPTNGVYSGSIILGWLHLLVYHNLALSLSLSKELSLPRLLGNFLVPETERLTITFFHLSKKTRSYSISLICTMRLTLVNFFILTQQEDSSPSVARWLAVKSQRQNDCFFNL